MLGWPFLCVVAVAGSTIRVTNSAHGECDISPSSSGLSCWMGGTSFTLRYFQDPGAADVPAYLHVGWGNSAYSYMVERSVVTSRGKWCYAITVNTDLYGEEIRVTKDGDVYSNAHQGRCTLSSQGSDGKPRCCTLQSVEYCVHETGSPMSWGGNYLSAKWGAGAFKVALVADGGSNGDSVAGIGCVGCGAPKNETTCIGQWT